MQVYLYVKPLRYTVIQYSGVDKYFNCISDIANVIPVFQKYTHTETWAPIVSETHSAAKLWPFFNRIPYLVV